MCTKESADGSSKLNISWSYNNGSLHQGEIDLEWLRENSYSPTSLRERQQHSMPPVTVSATKGIETLIIVEVKQEGIGKWMLACLSTASDNNKCQVTSVYICKVIPHSRKYWWLLNLAVWPTTKRKKILAEFKFGSGTSQRITSS